MSGSHSVSIGSCTDWSPGVPLEIGTQQRGVSGGDLDEDQIRVVRGLEERSRVVCEIGLGPQSSPCLLRIVEAGRPRMNNSPCPVPVTTGQWRATCWLRRMFRILRDDPREANLDEAEVPIAVAMLSGEPRHSGLTLAHHTPEESAVSWSLVSGCPYRRCQRSAGFGRAIA